MTDTEHTEGSVKSDDAFKRKCAAESRAANAANKTFCALFPELLGAGAPAPAAGALIK